MSTAATEIKGWYEGRPAIVFWACRACDTRGYLPRHFCPRCGATALDKKESLGAGVVYTLSLMWRTPVAALRPFVPYAIVLVDLVEGIRVLAHGDPDLRIGDRVTATYRPFGDRVLPHFVRARTAGEKDRNEENITLDGL